MANELNIALATSGLTVTAQRYQGGAAVGSAISLSEVSSSGFYTGNMTGSAGTYQLAFISSAVNVGSGEIIWDGTNEVPVSTLTAAQVNTECDTALSDVGLTSTVTGRIDATISSRLATSGYTTPPTVVAIRTEMDNNSTKLANLDATVSSRLASASYTAPANSDITAIKAKTDNLPASPAATGDIPSAATIADEVWDTQTSALTTSGAIGTRLKNSSTVATTGAQLAAALS